MESPACRVASGEFSPPHWQWTVPVERTFSLTFCRTFCLRAQHNRAQWPPLSAEPCFASSAVFSPRLPLFAKNARGRDCRFRAHGHRLHGRPFFPSPSSSPWSTISGCAVRISLTRDKSPPVAHHTSSARAAARRRRGGGGEARARREEAVRRWRLAADTPYGSMPLPSADGACTCSVTPTTSEEAMVSA